jgi:hypothetical protein
MINRTIKPSNLSAEETLSIENSSQLQSLVPQSYCVQPPCKPRRPPLTHTAPIKTAAQFQIRDLNTPIISYRINSAFPQPASQKLTHREPHTFLLSTRTPQSKSALSTYDLPRIQNSILCRKQTYLIASISEAHYPTAHQPR